MMGHEFSVTKNNLMSVTFSVANYFLYPESLQVCVLAIQPPM